VPSERSLVDVIQDALGLTHLRVVSTGGDHLAGGGVLALEPGVVMAFDHDTSANALLARRGIDVHTIARPRLGRGRGIACPISREA
jgi:arginine deiminase